MSNCLLEVKAVHKYFTIAENEVKILRDVSLNINEGDFLVILGPSGCGKSTLLHIMLGLELPTKGEVIFFGKNFYENTTEDDRSDLRKRHVGMVYQQPNWIKSLTVEENIAFPLQLLGESKQNSLEKARETLNLVGLLHWAKYIPTELSSGQQQRVALARALVSNPELIIADEPTGNLDYESGQDLMRLLTLLNKKTQKTIVMVTHDLEYLKFAKTAIKMFDGQIVGIYKEKDKSKLIGEIKGKRGVIEMTTENL